MSGRFEELVALVTYANVSLHNQDIQFDLGQATTEYCPRLEFIQKPPEGMASATVYVASNAEKWFAYLKEQNAKSVKLHYMDQTRIDIPDHITAAFVGGGGDWLVEVQYEDKNELYASGERNQWVLLEKDSKPLDALSPSVGDARERLDGILEKISSFAGKFEHTQHWSRIFLNAHETLAEFESHPSDVFIPFGIYSKEARQLIEASFLSSSVFGGMGSWNDQAFGEEDDKLYSTYSKELYDATRHGIVIGVNSYP